MTTRVVVLLAVVAATVLPLSTAFAQVEHAQRMATEVATRRAQIRAALCEQQRTATATSIATPQAERPALRLPTAPPVGSAGPVPLPTNCPNR